jgi:hypothetical protein
MMKPSSPTGRELMSTALKHTIKIAHSPPQSRKFSLASSPSKPSPLQLRLDDYQKNASGIAQNSRWSLEDVQDFDPTMVPPAMVRKKSGEIVRPALKPRTSKSEPTTPTCSKNVQFNLNPHIRLFLQAETPAAVVEDATDVTDEDDFQEGDLTYSLPNWPPLTTDSPLNKIVHVETTALSRDMSFLIGKVQVKNIAFQKRVDVRYTFDFWKTVKEVQAEYKESTINNMKNVSYDVFSFAISLKGKVGVNVAPKDEQSTMFFAVRYRVAGREFWDNNDGSNYQVEFERKQWTSGSSTLKPMPIKASVHAPAVKELGTSPPGFSSSPDMNAALHPRSVTKKKFSDRYDFSTARPMHHHQRVKSFPFSSYGNVADIQAVVDGYPASLYSEDQFSSIEQPITTAPTPWDSRGPIPIGVKSISSKTKPKESALYALGTSPIFGQRPSSNSSSYFEIVNNYCFYSTSPYSNSPPIPG